MYTNADMLHNKLQELEIIAKNENIDIISITETLIKNMPSGSQPSDYLFKLDGYNTVYNYNGRGLCLFIKKLLILFKFWTMNTFSKLLFL